MPVRPQQALPSLLGLAMHDGVTNSSWAPSLANPTHSNIDLSGNTGAIDYGLGPFNPDMGQAPALWFDQAQSDFTPHTRDDQAARTDALYQALRAGQPDVVDPIEPPPSLATNAQDHPRLRPYVGKPDFGYGLSAMLGTEYRTPDFNVIRGRSLADAFGPPNAATQYDAWQHEASQTDALYQALRAGQDERQNRAIHSRARMFSEPASLSGDDFVAPLGASLENAPTELTPPQRAPQPSARSTYGATDDVAHEIAVVRTAKAPPLKGKTGNASAIPNEQTRVAPYCNEDKSVCWPTDEMIVTDHFGVPRKDGRGIAFPHNGTDVRAAYNSNIFSSHSGTVSQIGRGGLGGTEIYISNDDGSTSIYSHIGPIRGMVAGKRVAAGEHIGRSNASGLGPRGRAHLHYMHKPPGSSTKVNPLHSGLGDFRGLWQHKSDLWPR
jgi:murein DD-endopeptidase MepM/ murein hydrolase activator NlpD